MEKETKYRNDLTEIRSMMEQSSRFISLSGLSGVFAGVYALIGAYLAYKISNYEFSLNAYTRVINLSQSMVNQLILVFLVVLVLAIGTGILMTTRKAKRDGHKIWSVGAKKLMTSLFIPLITGGLVILIFLNHGFIGIAAPLTLIFYGLALINASKYTLTDIRYLGFSEIVLGLIASYYIGYGLIFWAIGFGVLHIIYGTAMYFKNETGNA